MIDMEDDNEVDIVVTLNSLNILKNFYYREPTNGTMYNNLLEIKQNLHEKYSKEKLREKQITEFFKSF